MEEAGSDVDIEELPSASEWTSDEVIIQSSINKYNFTDIQINKLFRILIQKQFQILSI